MISVAVCVISKGEWFSGAAVCLAVCYQPSVTGELLLMFIDPRRTFSARVSISQAINFFGGFLLGFLPGFFIYGSRRFKFLWVSSVRLETKSCRISYCKLTVNKSSFGPYLLKLHHFCTQNTFYWTFETHFCLFFFLK